MVKRGTVWIAPEGWVPPGRMLDPTVTDFWVSWQDERALEDEVVSGADAAIRWGRERSGRVLIRLGHSHGTYFSAGDDHPTSIEEGENLPHWPPSGPPAEGWWYPPPLPTLDEVAAKARKLEAGEIDQEAAREWAEVMLIVHNPDDAELAHALWRLRGTDEPINR